MRLILTGLFLLSQFTAISQDTSTRRIDEAGFIIINGMEQWVTIKGNRSMPVVLFLHGGPGSPISPYADLIFAKWEKDFVLVQWDQRGAGKTFGRNRPAELSPQYVKDNPLTADQIVSDGIELTRYLLKHLDKDKIILFGTSWGSVPGVKMATQNPELFWGYVGHSQMVNPDAAMLSAYQTVLRSAQVANDQKSLDVLNSIGKPPYDTAKNLGRLMRVVKSYQQKKSVPPPAHWFEISRQYNNEKDNRDREDGDDYSFLSYAGDQRFGIVPMSSSINFLESNLVFKIPVYLIQGEEDIQTPAALTKEYFHKISAPAKEFIELPKTDHGLNQAVLDALYGVMKEISTKTD